MSRLMRLTVLPIPRKASSRKAGIVEMLRQVGQHQAECRGRVLEIVNEKGRDCLECLEFPGRRHFGGQTQVEQTGADLAADTFEQVHLFDRVGNAVDAIRQDGGAEPPVVCPQRHAYPMTAVTELAGADLPQILSPFSPRSVHVERPGQLVQPFNRWSHRTGPG